MAESQTIDTLETAPNVPKWIFDGSVTDHERSRYSNDVVAALKTVFDPEIPCDVYELGLVYKVDIDEHRLIRIEMTLTAPGCPVAGEITRSIETAVGTVPGTLGVIVSIVFEPPWDQGRMSDEARVSLDMF
jgi:FeS assembly SUF system protein